jgi:sugar (pentulose or hexulose) kinase
LAGLLIGTGAVIIPGIGPVIAAGTLASVLGATAAGAGIGAGVGAITGGLVGALSDMGVPEEDAHFYAEGVKRGGLLVVAQVNDADASLSASVMRQTNALEVDAERRSWEASGWQRFDETTTPSRTYPRL